MEIAICDDQIEIREIVRELLLKYGKLRNIECSIYEFGSGRELREGWKDFQILLLDLDMPWMDGIETAENLLASFDMRNCHIIVVSGLPERFQETYHIGAKDFVTKPIEETRFFAALDYAVNDINSGNIIIIRLDDREQKISEKDILYIKSIGNYCGICTKYGMGYRYIPISILKNELSDHIFFRCHRSYLVNLSYVRRVIPEGILLKNEEVLPISRMRRKEFEKALSDYIFGGM